MTTWYKAGTVSVTNGSATVGGAGTAWVASVQIGDAIHLPDGRAYEITSVASNTSLTVSPAYMGSTASAQAYRIQPTRGLVQRLIDTINTWLANQQAYLEGALAGRFGNGTAALPGISFGNDIDTGISRTAENQMSFSTNGIRRALLTNTALQLDALLTGSAIVSGTTDKTASKVLTTGYGGLGTTIALTASDNLNDIAFGGLYFNSTAGNTAGNNYPISSAGALIANYRSTTNASQIYITFADSPAFYFRSIGPSGWSPWSRSLTSNEVTQSSVDMVAGRLLKVGDFGVGGIPPLAANLSVTNNTLAIGTYRYDSGNGSLGGPVGATYGFVQHFRRATGGGEAQFAHIESGGSGSIGVHYRSRGVAEWTNWRRLLHHEMIIGAVSQSAGLPTGALMERGSNGNGEYVRYADGTLICTRTLTASASAAVTWTFPAAFSAAPVITGTAVATVLASVCLDSAPTTTSAALSVRDKTDARRADSMTLTAIGRWF